MEEQTIVASKPPSPSHDAPLPAQPTTSPEDTRTKLETTIIVLSLCASVFLAALDITIITTALPTISEYFQSNASYTWIGSAYMLANAASVPSWGKFSDIWGRKPILLVASAVFFVGSLLAAVSVSIGMLITARAIQGIGGGGLIILVNICITDLFSMRNRGAYYGVIGMVWALACAVGPILGGVFTEKVSWRWCFYINLWDGLKAVDWTGSLTVVGGTLMLLLGLEFGGVTHPWDSATVICLIVFGVLVGGLFILNEWKLARYPVMPLRIFKHRSNIASLGVCFCHGFVFIAGTYYAPLFFQAVLGATPLLSGVYLLPFAMSLSITSGFTGVFIKKTGKYLPAIWFGLSFMLLGFGLYIDFPRHPGWAKIIVYQIVAGIGNRYPTLLAALGPETASFVSGGSAGASIGLVSQLPAAQREIARDAFYQSLRTMWIIYVAFAALGLVCCAFVGSYVLSKEHQTTKTGLDEEEKHRREIKEREKMGREALKEEERGSTEAEKAEGSRMQVGASRVEV
ncbi:major facilitator superfamily transporter [Diplocarpon rosae]|nr:major facilitator superfamily transporter [Diplocarpon rosae]